MELAELLRKSRDAGRMAYERGADRAPLDDDRFMNIIDGGNHPHAAQCMRLWLEHWDRANLRADMDAVLKGSR